MDIILLALVEEIFEGNFLVLDRVAGLHRLLSGSDGLYRARNDILLSAVVLLIGFHLLELLLNQLHGFVLVLVLVVFLIRAVVVIFLADLYVSAELLQHVKFHVLQVLLLEEFLFMRLEIDGLLQVLD